jgi:hypothetical protein
MVPHRHAISGWPAEKTFKKKTVKRSTSSAAALAMARAQKQLADKYDDADLVFTAST